MWQAVALKVVRYVEAKPSRAIAMMRGTILMGSNPQYSLTPPIA